MLFIKEVKKLVLVALIFFGIIFVVRFVFGGSEDTWICENGQWIKHGSPAASKPTSGCGEENTLSQNVAYQVATQKCTDGKVLSKNAFYNENSKTWWFEFAPNEPKEGCNPACVVFVETNEVEINWRCTGLIQSNND